MIRLGKDKTLDNYFIDENGVITDENGNVQKTYLHQGRPTFKGIGLHKIMMFTFYGYKDGKVFSIHHLDENPLDNSLSNLIFVTKSEHNFIHKKGNKNPNFGKRGNKNPNFGKHLSEETRKKISESMKGNHHSEESKRKMSESHKGKSSGNKGKRHSKETKRKISKKIKGRIWVNNGVISKLVIPSLIPNGFKKGRI